MKIRILVTLLSASLFAISALADQGSSTNTPPYIQAIAPDVQFTSILTTGDVVSNYKMGGVPDGLGAYDNDDDTFTVLMNHEISANAAGPLGITRAHGGKGAYVSEWVINKKTLAVVSGNDLMKNVYQSNTSGSWVPVPATGTLGQTSSFARFCSADLADRSAFYNKTSRKGTKNRIFLNGEESNPTYQRGLAHVATGKDKGSTYVLPWAASANASWENLLANPYSGDRTVVIGNADGGTNGVYVYVGAKSKVGNDIEKAGLIGGTLYRVAVNGKAAESRAADAGLGLVVNSRGNYEGNFGLVAGADTANVASTRFLRPEDGAWDKKNRNRYYFVTTDQMDATKDSNINTDIATNQIGRSRLWALTFTDSANPELGGKVEMLLDGTSTKGDYQMFDNITVNDDGTLVMQEDVGNNQHRGKMWQFNPVDGSMLKLAGFDKALFGDIGQLGTLTKDEETSGVIDITEILDREDDNVYNLFVAQNHAASGDPETVEGGQLLLMTQPKPEHDEDEDDKK
jgi:secreted PhoX family phosphatase